MTAPCFRLERLPGGFAPLESAPYHAHATSRHYVAHRSASSASPRINDFGDCMSRRLVSSRVPALIMRSCSRICPFSICRWARAFKGTGDLGQALITASATTASNFDTPMSRRVSQLLDHLVGADEHRHVVEAECLGGLMLITSSYFVGDCTAGQPASASGYYQL